MNGWMDFRNRNKRKEVKAVRYSDARDHIQTGDVIGFNGKGVVSSLINLATNSIVSHVAMVQENIEVAGERRVLMIESTTLSGIPDLIDGRLRRGVQLHYLSQRLAEGYDGIFWLRLMPPLTPERAIQMSAYLSRVHKEEIPYDMKQAIGSGLDLFDWMGFVNEPDFSALFCSELVFRALQIVDVLGEDTNPSEATPADVFKLPCFALPLEVIPDAEAESDSYRGRIVGSELH